MTETIIKRKSIRHYKQEPLPEATIDRIVDYISSLTAPDESIDWNFDTLPYLDLVRIADREPGIKAPHYFVFRSEKKNFCLQNIGYIGEMAALYLAGEGIGTCWMGTVRITEDYWDCLPSIAVMAFGEPDEPLRASAQEAQRKALDKLFIGDSSGDWLALLEAARLAPSSFNRQPLSYIVRNGNMQVFRKRPLLNNPVVSYVQCIDAGAAMANICTEAATLGYSTKILKMTPQPTWNSKIYQATVRIEKKG